MSSHSPSDLQSPSPRHVTRSIHASLLEQSVPDWLMQATPQQRAALKAADAPLPPWYGNATKQRREAFDASLAAHWQAQSELGKVTAGLLDIHDFARPLLTKHLKDRFGVELDVDKTFLRLTLTVETAIFFAQKGSFDASSRTLLQAALHNFEEAECEPDAFHRSSGFFVVSGKAWHRLRTSLTVQQFVQACRTLDIGTQYQHHLKRCLYPQSPAAQQTLHRHFAAAQKAALRAAAERARLQNDIGPEDHALILWLTQADPRPALGDQKIWLFDLSLMRLRLTGCMVLAIGEPDEAMDELLIFIPDDPHHPLMRYNFWSMGGTLKKRFTENAPADGSPSAYQAFFSRFVPYAERAYYFSQFRKDAPQAGFGDLWAAISDFTDSSLRNLLFTRVPPASAVAQVPEDDPFLALNIRHPKEPSSGDGHGGFWGYLFERHRDQLIEDARSYAVPTADVDARQREERLARLLGIGMLALNAVSMFVPVLGEVMMGVMACQLLEESIEGVVEWSEGDRHAAKAHLLDVAQNLVLAGALIAAGKAVSGLARVAPEPVIENLHPVTLPNGRRRLIKAGLEGYEVPVEISGAPDALGRYEVDGKSYVRIDGHWYEQFFDHAIERWRIRHPREPQAWSPVLTHNGAGAWRHELENPLAWDRRTLLRRMGRVGDAYSDEQLARIADISGVSDNALRKMHMDDLPPVAEFADAMRLFDLDREVTRVIDQVHLGQSIDERYLLTLELLTRLPHWPSGRGLKVFADLERTGVPVEYGGEGATPRRSIRVSRQNILDGELPWRILAELDESEIIGLLGADAAQERVWRAQTLRDRFAAGLRGRRLELFERLQRHRRSKDPAVKALRRAWPRIGDAAALEVLEEADGSAVASLKSNGQVQGKMQVLARWHSRRGRLTRALAGLHMDNMTTADTRRLALHALGRMSGWPDSVRLEIHDGQFAGRLVDSLGSETAGLRCYVVKKGPAYEAVDGQGRPLAQSFEPHGDFFAAVAQAVPLNAQETLGVPFAQPGVELRRWVGHYVLGHLDECAQALARRGAKGRWFNPARRVGRYSVGYRASGEGAIGNAGLGTGLVIRLRFLYPEMTPSQANGLILEKVRSGQSDEQILQWLEHLRGQWMTLKQGLKHWVDQGEALASRRSLARDLKESWRSAPFVKENPAHGRLDLQFDGALPQLSTTFDHVVELRLRPVAEDDRAIQQFLRNFPMLERLDLSGVQMHRLDVSGMKHLRRLRLDGSRLLQAWPQGAESLESVSGVDLSNRSVVALPPVFFLRDDLLLNTNLSGARLTPQGQQLLQDAHRRCERVLGLPERTLERFFREAVPEGDSRPRENGSLLATRLLPWPAPLPAGEDVPSFMARLRRIDAALSEDEAAVQVQRLRDGATDEQVGQILSEWEQQFESLTRELNGWIFSRRTGSALQGGRWTSSKGRGDAAKAIVECWKKGLADVRAEDGPWLDLSHCRGLGVLPRLPSDFAHVRGLQLRGIGLNEADLHRFLPSFTGLRSLELELNELRSLPSAIAEMPGLALLGLSGNRLDNVEALVRRLGAAHRLTTLKLSYNRFRSLDGDALQALQGLRELDLSHNPLRHFNGALPDSLRSLQLNANDLRHWPDAVMAAPQLETLNLAGNPIRDIPARVFDGSHDRLLAGTRIYSAVRTLSTESLLRIQAWMDRTGASDALGFSRERLDAWILDDEGGMSEPSSSERSDSEQDVPPA